MTSRKAAIDQFCKGCIYDQYEPGTWRQQVEQCNCQDCELYEHRPLPIAVQRCRSKLMLKAVIPDLPNLPLRETMGMHTEG